MLPTPPRSRVLSILALCLTLAAFPLGALANHDFADVPDSNIYHADIDALADSGVTTGCGGGNFCPSAYVTREQMAAFMNRLGALGPGKVPVVNADELDGLTSGQFARSDVPMIGRYNCIGKAALQPSISGTSYALVNNGRYSLAGAITFNCPVLLPDGATVLALRAGVFDESATLAVPNCGLLRYPVLASGSPVFLAITNGSGAADTPGDITLEDLIITDAVIDNALYAYEAECSLGGASSFLRLNGISIEYTVSGLAVP